MHDLFLKCYEIFQRLVSCIAEIGVSLSIGKFCSGMGNPRCSEKIWDIIQKDIISATQ